MVDNFYDVVKVRLNEAILTSQDVKEGKITNLTNYGMFVDIGAEIDGFVHISELSDKFIKAPSTMFKVGESVRVKILSMDPRKKRIALSIKKIQAPQK